MRILGLDLAGVENRPSGFCVLKKMNAQTDLVCTDRQIIHRIEGASPALVAIDAPLSLPPGRKRIEDRTDVHLRECDKELLRRRIKFFPITLGPMRQLTRRGINLRRLLKSRGFRVIEVYPGGAQDVLNIPRKRAGSEGLRKGLEQLGITGLNEDMTHHELDAVTCAYVGKLFLKGRSETFGYPDTGIVMPKPQSQAVDGLSNVATTMASSSCLRSRMVSERSKSSSCVRGGRGRVK